MRTALYEAGAGTLVGLLAGGWVAYRVYSRARARYRERLGF